MRISYQYNIKPSKEQIEKIDNILEMLRYQYNYLLAQRFDWYEMNRCPIDNGLKAQLMSGLGVVEKPTLYRYSDECVEHVTAIHRTISS